MSLSLTKNVLDFIRGKADVFVETGTFMGGGVRCAHEYGFKEIHSIEMSAECHRRAKAALRDIPGVDLILGDSSVEFPKLMATITRRAVVFLDGHNMQGNPHTANVKGDGKSWLLSPLRREIESLKQAPVKDHLVLIDDIDYLGKSEMDFLSLDESKRMMLEVNPAYQFTIMDGARAKSLLIASVP